MSAAAATLALAALLVLVPRMDSASLEEGEGGSEEVGLLIITKKYYEIIDYYEIVVLDNYVSYPVIRYDIVFIPYGIASYDKT